MIALPPALVQWREELELLDPALARELGPFVQRLAAAIGPLRTQTQLGTGEPDGYAGLTRRGAYERLVTSEWVLADALPDEFLRRAAMGEHAFYDLARQMPAERPQSVALFDAGPGQIGTPRIVHLALLIVLHRRAASARIPFAWGILQQPTSPLTPDLTASSGQRLLTARTSEPVTGETLALWRERLPRGPQDDVWVVGLPVGQTLEASRVAVNDVLTPDVDALDVEITPRRRAKQTLRLTLPERGTCTAILREPFGRRASTDRVSRTARFRVDPRTTPLFTANGRHVLVRLEGGSIAAFAILRAGTNQVRKCKLFILPENERLICIGYKEGGFVGATKGSQHTRIFGLTREHRWIPDTSWAGSHPEPAAVNALLPCSDITNGVLEFTDGGGGMFNVARMEKENQLVHGTGPEVGLVAVLFRKDAPRLTAMLGAGTVAVEVSPTESLSMKVDAFGARTFYGAPPPGRTQPIAAVRMGQGLWSVLSEAKAPNYSVLLTPPPGEVVGVVPVEPKTERPGLVVLDEGRRSVSVCGRRGSTQLFSLSEEIAQVVVSPYHADSVITVVTRAGSLGFHNSGQASVIMHPDTKGKS